MIPNDAMPGALSEVRKEETQKMKWEIVVPIFASKFKALNLPDQSGDAKIKKKILIFMVLRWNTSFHLGDVPR